jgi:RNA polymerase sigma factor (sigma-70 family)
MKPAEVETLRRTRDERFEELFREHYGAVRGYALRRMPGDLAQDVVSETFLVAWRRLDDVPADALPWLYGVARRVVANQRRSAERSSALERRVAGTAAANAVSNDLGEDVGEGEFVRAALGRLSDRDREVLMLVAWHGLSGARAARAAGCTRGAFAVRLHRARARLAAELDALRSPAAPIVNAESLEAS